MKEAPEAFARWLDTIPKSVSGSLYCPTHPLPSVSLTLVLICWTRTGRSPISKPPKQRTDVAIDSRLLDHYTGRYQVTPALILEITRDGDRLFAQAVVQAMSGPKFELFAESETKFFAKVSDKQIAFETDAEGRAMGLVLYASGRPPTPAARVS